MAQAGATHIGNSHSGNAIPAILQYLKDSGLDATHAALQEETVHMFDASEPLQGGMLLQALQLLEEQQEQQKIVAGAQSAEDKAIEAQLLSRHAGPKNNVCRLHASFDSIHKANILTVRFSPAPGDDLIVATGSVDKSLKLTNLSSGATLFELAGGIIKSAVLCIEFHPTHPQLVLCGCMDGSVFIVDTSAPLERAVVHQSTQHRKYVVAVKWLPVVEAPAPSSASASSSDDQKEAPSDAAATAAPFSFASASYDHTVTLWSAVAVAANGTPDKWTMKREHVFAGTVEAIECVVGQPSLCVSVRDDNYLHLIDTRSFDESGRVNMNVKGDDHVSFTVMHLSSSKDGAFLLASTDKHRTMIYRAGRSQIVRNFFGATNNEFSNPRHCWSHDERFVYATSQDHALVCWEVATQRQLGKLVGHAALVRDLHRHPTKNLLVSCGFDKTVKVWASAE